VLDSLVVRRRRDGLAGTIYHRLPHLHRQRTAASVVSNSWRHKIAPVAQEALFFRCSLNFRFAEFKAPGLH
jgi:hypothetical protein